MAMVRGIPTLQRCCVLHTARRFWSSALASTRPLSQMDSSQENAEPRIVRGRADPDGTALYAKMFATAAEAGHFRHFPTESEVGSLTVSSVGLGTYLGPATDAADEEYAKAALRALALGINVFDTAINYRSMRSERAIGRALAEAIESGTVKRNQVLVCTKGGYLGFDTVRPPDPRAWIEETFIKRHICAWEDFVEGHHCMAPSYIKDQFEKSRKNLGLESIDVYYIHNPETQLELAAIAKEEFYNRIREAFKVLEDACAEGKLSVYGTATWDGFRVPPEAKGHLSLEDLVRAAYEAGGDRHHFKVVQLPYNLALQEADTKPTQMVKGQKMTLLRAAQELGVSVVASASLMQANLCKSLPDSVLEAFTHADLRPTSAQCALQFVRTTPNVITGLAGMRNVHHVEENAGVLKFPATPRQSL